MLLHGTPFYIYLETWGEGGMGLTKGAEPVLWTPIATELLIVLKNNMGNKERFLEFRAHKITMYVY